MKTLFIAKKKQPNKPSTIIQRQVESLKNANFGAEIHLFVCKGNGIKGYYSIYKTLKSELRKSNFDLIHAHYSFIGFLTLLAAKKNKVVVSFMGSDLYFKAFIYRIARKYILKKADHIIVKSTRLKNLLPNQSNISIIPNGVNLVHFQLLEKKLAQEKLNWPKDKIHILFPSGKDRYEKNFPLAEQALQLLQPRYNIELHCLENIPPNEVPIYLNAADLVLLTSRWEGSSNVTKEAMACNTPVVSTDVGDAAELFDGVEGYYIASHSAQEIANQVEQAITFAREKQKTAGREQIIQLGLDEDAIANRIFEVYKSIIE